MPTAPSTGGRRLPARRVKPSGAWGVWLDARLIAKGMTQKQAYDQLRGRWPELFPWGDYSLDSFRAYIRGKVPDDQQQAAFIELFGGPGPTMAGAGSDTTQPVPAALIEALTAQTAAISELAAQVKALVEAQPAPTELASALVELVRSGLLAGSPAGEPVGGPPRS